jgi:hypothetical protein
MIKMKQPALALHSYNVPDYEFKMWQTWKMPKNATSLNVVNWINWAIDHSPDLYLHNVIINCHGYPGALRIGVDCLMTTKDVGFFTPLRKKSSIGKIWLIACKVAKGAGKQFCSDLAVATGAHVIAADESQQVDIKFYCNFCPSEYIDDFEGTAFIFSPAGGYEIWTGDD